MLPRLDSKNSSPDSQPPQRETERSLQIRFAVGGQPQIIIRKHSSSVPTAISGASKRELEKDEEIRPSLEKDDSATDTDEDGVLIKRVGI